MNNKQYNMEPEPECDEQRQARDYLEQLEQALGPPTADHPTQQASVEKTFRNTMEWLRKETIRPASQRLPKDATPPREVLSCAMNVTVFDPLPPSANGYHLRLVRFVHEKHGKMWLGFSLTTQPDEYGGEPKTANVASAPWKKQMGSWPAINWAFLLAAVIRRFGWLPMRSMLVSYKVQDVPEDGFDMEVYTAYVDIVRGNRYNQMGTTDVQELSGLFANNLNIDRMNDLALTFDTRLWRVAYDLGIQVEDYSSRPGLSFLVGFNEIVIDGSANRRQWDSVKSYIYGRFDGATIHPDLSEEEAEKHKTFLWEVLKTQQIKEIQRGTEDRSFEEIWRLYSEYAENKLGSKLRRIAKTFDMKAPSLATERVTVRCDYCNKPEGEAVGDDGQLGARLLSCACNPNGKPRYCNSACQKADWSSHKEFCTAVVEKKKKSKDKDNVASDSKKKKKDKKKKKK